jgi:hypothetical protein
VNSEAGPSGGAESKRKILGRIGASLRFTVSWRRYRVRRYPPLGWNARHGAPDGFCEVKIPILSFQRTERTETRMGHPGQLGWIIWRE